MDTVANERRTRELMTSPEKNGTPTLPRRGGPKGLLPSTWIDRTLKVEYTGAGGELREATATLLDFYPAGPILSIAGAKTLLSWDRLVLAELVEDG